MPSTQSLSNRSLASDAGRQFCDQMSLISSDNIVQKGLACGRHWSGNCPLISGAKGAARSCPAGSIAEVGHSVVRRDAAKPNGGSQCQSLQRSH